MRKLVFAYLAVGACSGGAIDPGGGGGGDGPADAAARQDGPATTPDAPGAVTADAPTLHGVPPALPKAAPEFMAINRDGSPRNRSHLTTRGPTVMWFYPAAGTSG